MRQLKDVHQLLVHIVVKVTALRIAGFTSTTQVTRSTALSLTTLRRFESLLSFENFLLEPEDCKLSDLHCLSLICEHVEKHGFLGHLEEVHIDVVTVYNGASGGP